MTKKNDVDTRADGPSDSSDPRTAPADRGVVSNDDLSPFAARARSLGLRFNETSFHDELMTTEIRYWPESLKELADARQRLYGLCGDVIATAVADWIAQRTGVNADLLEALRVARHLLKTSVEHPAVAQIDDVIAKAEGRQ